MKIAIVFDIFTERGGAERVAIMLAKKLNADIITTYVDWGNVDKELNDINVIELGLIFKNLKLITYTEIMIRFFLLNLASYYDSFIFLRVYSLTASIKNKPSIWVSSGILEPVYDMYESFCANLSLWKRPIFKLWSFFYRHITQNSVEKFDKICANSKLTKRKIKQFYGLDSDVVYHPTETDKFRCESYDNFYLTTSRLVRQKRIDLIIKAFKDMPRKRLVIAGDGPDRERLEKIADSSKNIEFLGSVNFEEIIGLYSKCTATFSLYEMESLGLIPIESMASGKPCIASNSGGHKETIIDGETGFLINVSVEEIKKYVKYLTPERARKMKEACIKRSKKFNVEEFIKEIKGCLKGI